MPAISPPPHTPALTPSSAPPRPQKPGLLGRGVQRSGGGGVCGGRLHGSHRQRLPQLTTAATPHLARDRVSWCNVPETAPRTLPQVLAIINRILLLPTRSIILTHHLHPTTRRGPTSPANYLATVFRGRRCWRGGSDSCGDVGVIGCQAVSAPHPTPPHHPTPTSTRFSRDTCHSPFSGGVSPRRVTLGCAGPLPNGGDRYLYFYVSMIYGVASLVGLQCNKKKGFESDVPRA